MTIPTLPTAPSRGLAPDVFAITADAWVAALPAWTVAANATGAQAAADAASAAASSVSATEKAAAALASEIAAANNSSASKWISGTPYAIGAVRWSPLTYVAYRRKTAGAGATDPSADATNWAPIQLQTATQVEMEAGTEVALRAVSPLLVKQAIDVRADGVVAASGGGAITESKRIVMLHDSENYTIPSVSTTGSGFGVGCIASAALKATYITTADGWSIPTGFSADATKILMPIYKGNAKGVWPAVTGGACFPPILGQLAAPSTGYTFAACVDLTATLSVAVLVSGTALYAVAVDTSANTVGALVSLGLTSNISLLAIYANSSSTFVVANQRTSGTFEATAGSVSGTVITLGAAVTLGLDVAVSPLVKLADGLYVLATDDASAPLLACSVSGTTVSVGTGVSVGQLAGLIRIARVSNTVALVAYLSTGGGTTTTRAFNIRTASVSGTTITLNTAATGTSICNEELGFLAAYAEGSSYIASARCGTPSTSGNWYGVTVSGTTVTLGSVSTQALNRVTSYTPMYGRGVYKPKDKIYRYSTTTMLFGHLATGPFAVTISGTTLTFGASGGPATVVDFLTDANTGANVYAVGASQMNKLSVAGVVVSSSWQLAVTPSVIVSDDLNDKSAKYGGAWYAQAFPVSQCVKPTKWLIDTGANVTISGPIY